MLPTGFADILELVQSDTPGLRFTYSGIPIEGGEGENICEAAYRLMASMGSLGGVQVHLHKQIPVGAGLGGGSADGSFMLKMLNDFFQRGLSVGEIELMSAELGSDCPFFVRNVPAFVTGRGEQLEPFCPELSRLQLAILLPTFRISTAWAYQQIVPDSNRSSLKFLLSQPTDVWRETIVNDFEAVVFKHYPEAMWIKEELYRCGAVYAQMSGSGSSFFGLFSSTPLLSARLQKVCVYSGSVLQNLMSKGEKYGVLWGIWLSLWLV
jgi:4-diphosphocytidyl-2-C-methyl-D-erythritol kinase